MLNTGHYRSGVFRQTGQLNGTLGQFENFKFLHTFLDSLRHSKDIS